MSLFKDKEEDVDEGEGADYDPEAEVVGNWKICDLPQIATVTGEEEEDALAKMRSKIYRWRGEWKERGIGQLKFLKHKKSGLIRILVRAQKTHKCIVNHFIQAKDIFCKLEQMKTSNNAWSWAAYDISDEKPATEKFCAKFTSKDDFLRFKEEFQKACQVNESMTSNEKKEEEPAQKEEQPPKEAEKEVTESKEQKGQ